MVIATDAAARKPFINPIPTEPPFIWAYGTLDELAAIGGGWRDQFMLWEFFQEQMREGFFESVNIPLPGLPCPVLTIKIRQGGR